jgi:hypothetical protein
LVHHHPITNLSLSLVPGDLLTQTRSQLLALEEQGADKALLSHWRKREGQVLALYTMAPLAGGAGLYYTQIALPSPLLSSFSVSLFFLAAFLGPFLHLSGIIKESFLKVFPFY